MAEKIVLIIGKVPTEAIETFAEELESKHHKVVRHFITDDEYQALGTESNQLSLTLYDTPFATLEQTLRARGDSERKINDAMNLVLSGGISHALSVSIEHVAFALTSTDCSVGKQAVVRLFDIYKATTGIIAMIDDYGIQYASGSIYMNRCRI